MLGCVVVGTSSKSSKLVRRALYNAVTAAERIMSGTLRFKYHVTVLSDLKARLHVTSLAVLSEVTIDQRQSYQRISSRSCRAGEASVCGQLVKGLAAIHCAFYVLK